MALENYVPVPVRIAKFKKDHNGEGSITTESFINFDKEVASFKATIKVGDKVIATGHSLVGDLADDKAFEKGETTAIGRALVHAGYEAESLDYDEESSSSSSKSSKSSKKSGLGKGLGASKKASKVEETEEEETEEEETEEEEAPKKKAKGLPSIGKSSKKKVAKDEEEEESEEEESEEETEEESEEEEEETPKKKASKGGSSKLDNVMAKYGLK